MAFDSPEILRSAAAYLERADANRASYPRTAKSRASGGDPTSRVALPPGLGRSGAFKWLTSAAARVQVQEKSGKGRTPLAGGGIADLRC